MADEVQRQPGFALFADEVALEEAAARDEVVLGRPRQQRDAAFDRDQAGVQSAGQDLRGQVDQFGVFAPGPDGDGDVPAWPQERHQSGEDAGEPGQQPVVADVGEVSTVEGVAVEVSGSATNGAATDVDKPTEDGADATSEKTTRLAPGGLRGMVEDYLRDHPGEAFGPTAIANALGGKSSGAVSNALDKLVTEGVAAKTQDKPRRFALAPAEPEAGSATN